MKFFPLAVLLIISVESSAVTLHGKILDVKTRVLVNANVDIYCNSDFIKTESEKVLKGEFEVPLNHYGWYIITILPRDMWMRTIHFG